MIKNVRVWQDSWWRTAQNMLRRARAPTHAPTHKRPRADAGRCVRVWFAGEGVLFDELTDFGGVHGSFRDAETVRMFQRCVWCSQAGLRVL